MNGGFGGYVDIKFKYTPIGNNRYTTNSFNFMNSKFYLNDDNDILDVVEQIQILQYPDFRIFFKLIPTSNKFDLRRAKIQCETE